MTALPMRALESLFPVWAAKIARCTRHEQTKFTSCETRIKQINDLAVAFFRDGEVAPIGHM
jgi:hypothetical protein